MQEKCNNYNCTKGQYFIQKQFNAPEHTKWSCPFLRSMLGPCSGLEDPSFGYNCSMPCVVIKMNRVRFTLHLCLCGSKARLDLVIHYRNE